MAWINYESMRQSDTMAPTNIPGKSQEKYFLFVYYILSHFRHYNISLYCSVRSNLFALMYFYLFSTELARWRTLGHTGGNSIHCPEMAPSSLRSLVRTGLWMMMSKIGTDRCPISVDIIGSHPVNTQIWNGCHPFHQWADEQTPGEFYK